MSDLTIKPAQFPAVEELCREYLFKPFRHQGVDRARLDLLFQGRVRNALAATGARGWMAMRGDQVCGLLVHKELPWDTALLGVNAGRVDLLLATGTLREQAAIKATLLRHIVRGAEPPGIRHLSCRIDAEDISSVHALEASGYALMDGINTFTIETHLRDADVNAEHFSIRLGNESDAGTAAALGRTAFTVDRFHNDPEVAQDKADNLYAEWVRNSFSGKAAQGTVVAEDASGMLGFVTCQLQADTTPVLGFPVGTIGLVATKAEARGRGVGRKMTLRALAWLEAQGCAMTEVGTQMANIPAARLYEACGFRLASSSLSFRAWLGSGGCGLPGLD